MDDLTDPAGLVALAAGALALLALIMAIVLAVKLRRLRAAQSVVLGPSGRAFTGVPVSLDLGWTAR